MEFTKCESLILRELADGLTYLQIQGKLRMSQASVHTHCCRIMKKTGLKSLKNHIQCLRFVEKSVPHLVPTHTQQIVLQRLADGFSHQQISMELGISTSTVHNHASQACQRLKIAETGPDRLAAIRAYLGWGGFLNGDPML